MLCLWQDLRPVAAGFAADRRELGGCHWPAQIRPESAPGRAPSSASEILTQARASCPPQREGELEFLADLAVDHGPFSAEIPAAAVAFSAVSDAALLLPLLLYAAEAAAPLLACAAGLPARRPSRPLAKPEARPKMAPSRPKTAREQQMKERERERGVGFF